MISKELICAVLGFKAIKKLEINLNGEYDPVASIYYITDTEEGYLLLNIYELAYKCKLWAFKHDFMLNTVILRADGKSWYCEDDYRTTFTTWKADSEPEVIFKACEWILYQLKNTNE